MTRVQILDALDVLDALEEADDDAREEADKTKK